MPSEIHTDPLIPTLAASTPVSPTTAEQKDYIKRILALCCSDTRFADKAYIAILLVLKSGEEPPVPLPEPTPAIIALNPNTAVIGGPDFTLHVVGGGFIPTSQIFINNVAAPTTFVSAAELTTDVDMGLVLAPVVAPVTVKNGAIVSNVQNFTVTV